MPFLVTLLILLLVDTATAAEPQRGISLSTTYTSITIEPDQTVNLAIEVRNTGPQGEYIDITIASAPKGWEAHLVNEEFARPYGVRSLYLPAGDKASQTIYFKVKPPEEAKAGDYEFVVRASTQDKLVTASLKLSVGLVEKVTMGEGVKLTTMYPVLRGPSGGSFTFRVDLMNETNLDRTFQLSAVAPLNWEVSFTPAYESTQVSTIRLKVGETKGIDVKLAPPRDIGAGNYGVRVGATSEGVGSFIDLAVVITGTYDLTIGTPTGRLNAEATAGRGSHISILATNSGSAELRNINFSSSKPGGWVITFSPDRLLSLAAGEVREIDVTITPPGKAVAGDYAVSLSAFGDRASSSIDLRVSLGTATTWGWIGLGIVVAVIAGMVAVFWRVGRR